MVSLKEMIGFEVEAEDGSAGRISDFFLEETDWKVGYAVVSVGGFLSGERWLVSVAELRPTASRAVMTTLRSRAELAAHSPRGLITKEEEGWALSHGDEAPTGDSESQDPQSPWRSFNSILGCRIAASDGGYGVLDDALVDPDRWLIQYFVGRSHAWKKKPSVLIPIAWVKEISPTAETVDVSVSRDALEREPSYKPESHGHPH